jgi:hypothetical protein
MPVDNSGSMKSLSDATAAAGFAPGNSSLSSTEQLYSPVLIRKNNNSNESPLLPGFELPSGDGKSSGLYAAGSLEVTRTELDPYFSNVLGDSTTWMAENDFQIALNDGTGSEGPDANLRKVDRETVTVVSVNHLRGPLIMAGFGSDHADRPAIQGSTAFSFDQGIVNDRSLWKAGPIDLKWDMVRKVWGAGHHVVCGVASGAISAPVDPCQPTTFEMRIFRNPKVGNPVPVSLTNCDTEETLIVTNRDPSLSQEDVPGMVFVMAIRVNYEYLPVWVGCPDQVEPDAELPSCVCDGSEPEPDPEPEPPSEE